ncbi:putative glycoprotein [Wenzhou pacific spadenose shark paramyxovirus]|uniref:Putative glycoprotein n=1 Tax=Wenzhou pacific spadenose shark paramyxovirus TaxID=2116452 RepID=A0A2P1GMX6_9MONO|nr:putative glycoprotein [Wenzhou pacific spadenose shark paramyxovirus]AVM87355.1 putative glycoprotein [Wenzhou pacific spadenose shark paramyxovirus]
MACRVKTERSLRKVNFSNNLTLDPIPPKRTRSIEGSSYTPSSQITPPIIEEQPSLTPSNFQRLLANADANDVPVKYVSMPASTHLILYRLTLGTLIFISFVSLIITALLVSSIKSTSPITTRIDVLEHQFKILSANLTKFDKSTTDHLQSLVLAQLSIRGEISTLNSRGMEQLRQEIKKCQSTEFYQVYQKLDSLLQKLSDLLIRLGAPGDDGIRTLTGSHPGSHIYTSVSEPEPIISGVQSRVNLLTANSNVTGSIKVIAFQGSRNMFAIGIPYAQPVFRQVFITLHDNQHPWLAPVLSYSIQLDDQDLSHKCGLILGQDINYKICGVTYEHQKSIFFFWYLPLSSELSMKLVLMESFPHPFLENCHPSNQLRMLTYPRMLIPVICDTYRESSDRIGQYWITDEENPSRVWLLLEVQVNSYRAQLLHLNGYKRLACSSLQILKHNTYHLLACNSRKISAYLGIYHLQKHSGDKYGYSQVMTFESLPPSSRLLAPATTLQAVPVLGGAISDRAFVVGCIKPQSSRNLCHIAVYYPERDKGRFTIQSSISGGFPCYICNPIVPLGQQKADDSLDVWVQTSEEISAPLITVTVGVKDKA